MRYIFFIFLFFGLVFQNKLLAGETSKVRWLKSMKEYYNLEQSLRDSLPMLVDLWTDWCGWCVVMDKKTYSNDSVANFINSHFIPVKFNAETREEFNWHGVKYRFDDQFNIHNFAKFLTSGRAAFPTTVIVWPNGKFETVPGFLRVHEIEPLLKFFTLPEKERDWNDFNRQFKNAWR